MTTFTNISNTTAEKDKPLTQSLVRALRDNPLAIAEGDVTAPSILMQALRQSFVAGDLVQAKSDASSGPFGLSYAKFKEIRVPHGGGLRVKWTILTGNSTVNSRVYVNGVAVSPEQTTPANNDPVNLSADITGINAGDLIQLYARTSVGGLGAASNFRICVAHGNQFEVIL
jgi:hypothetical protein